MVLEVAILNVIKGKEKDFEQSFKKAESIITSSKGYQNHQLKKCIETPNRYLLQVNWATLEDHTKGFRGSEQYQKWKALLHHYYEPFPTVEHYL